VGILKFGAVLGGPFHDAPPESETLKLQLGIGIPIPGPDFPNLSGVSIEGLIAAVMTFVFTNAPQQPPIQPGIGIILDAQGQISTASVVFAQIQFTAEFDALVVQYTPDVIAQGTFDIQADITIAWCVDQTWEDQGVVFNWQLT
jgi:hypothetical protein